MQFYRWGRLLIMIMLTINPINPEFHSKDFIYPYRCSWINKRLFTMQFTLTIALKCHRTCMNMFSSACTNSNSYIFLVKNLQKFKQNVLWKQHILLFWSIDASACFKMELNAVALKKIECVGTIFVRHRRPTNRLRKCNAICWVST